MLDDTKQIEATILNVIPDERIGGPQQRVLQVATRLKDSHFETIVVTPKGDQAYANLLRDAGIPYHQMGSFRRLPNVSNPLDVAFWFFCFVPCIFALIRLINKTGADIVHVNGGLCVQVAIAAKLSKAKLIWHLNDVRKPRLSKPILLPLLHLLPDKLVGTSKAVGECYFGKSTYAKKMTILYPPIDTSRFHPDDTKTQQHREEFGFTPDDKVVGIVGNLNPNKGYEYFFPAATLIKQSAPQVKFLVVGKQLDTQNSYWNKLHDIIGASGIEAEIVFAGHRTDIPDMLNVMDVFVSSSVGESFSMVSAEAMACARPVVATNTGGIPEVVEDGKTGLLALSRDPESIAKAVLYLLDHPEEANQMGIKGRDRVLENFDLEICARRHEKIYKTVLEP